MRYPPQLDEHEDGLLRLDDHLTAEEVRERFAALDRMAMRARCIVCGLVICECEPAAIWHGRPYIRSALGGLGIVVAVLGMAAVIYGARGEEVTSVTSNIITTSTHMARCEAGWTLVMQGNGRPGCAWVVKDAE